MSIYYKIEENIWGYWEEDTSFDSESEAKDWYLDRRKSFYTTNPEDIRAVKVTEEVLEWQ